MQEKQKISSAEEKCQETVRYLSKRLNFDEKKDLKNHLPTQESKSLNQPVHFISCITDKINYHLSAEPHQILNPLCAPLPPQTLPLPSQFKCHSCFPPSLHPHPISPSLSTAVVHALSAAGMLNAHFTQFAQRFTYLQVNCCECSRC